jgi:tetratricopeptide (TPR) repeat protein
MSYLVVFAVLLIAFFVFLTFQKRKGQGSKGNKFSVTDFHLEQAQDAESKGDFNKAGEEYRKSLRISKKHEPEKYEEVLKNYEEFVRRSPVEQMDISNIISSGPKSDLDNAYHHIEQARKAEQNGDYFAARMDYLKSVEILKRTENTEELKKATKEYEDFIKRDPLFKKLIDVFLAGIRENPGILQSDITKKAEDMDWSELYNKDRPIAKEDIRYVLYFADKFGLVIRKKEGRSYRLYLPEQVKDAM